MAFLTAENVSKQFGNHLALNRVSLEVPQQSIFGLLGPNGAGKTTLIRIINQITGPDEGEVKLNGRRLAPNDISQIGYLPEERGLYKKMKVGEQALYLAQLKGLSRQSARAALKIWFEKFEITSWWDKKVEELSKGMQQKIQFIVTVIHKPALIILDEPFSGFDPINAELIKQEILELQKEGATVIFSTHNMGSVEELCDHIALIHKAENILSGSVREIRKGYESSTYDICFKGNLMGFTNALWSGGELIDKQFDGEKHRVRVKLNGQMTTNQLLTSIMPQAEILSLQEVIPSMNEIFISKVKEENPNTTHTKNIITE